jgi:hypothetical protein
MKTLRAILAVMLFSSIAIAEDVYVDGYTRKNGTYVAPHYRSRPNAYQWDNKSYTPSQPAYNNSSGRNHNSNWYTPSETRYNDSNRYNDSPSYGSQTKPSRILEDMRKKSHKAAYGW